MAVKDTVKEVATKPILNGNSRFNIWTVVAVMFVTVMGNVLLKDVPGYLWAGQTQKIEQNKTAIKEHAEEDQKISQAQGERIVAVETEVAAIKEYHSKELEGIRREIISMRTEQAQRDNEQLNYLRRLMDKD